MFNSLRYGFLLTFLFSIFGCEKETTNPNAYILTKIRKSLYQKGTFWIYECDQNNFIDSVYLDSVAHFFHETYQINCVGCNPVTLYHETYEMCFKEYKEGIINYDLKSKRSVNSKDSYDQVLYRLFTQYGVNFRTIPGFDDNEYFTTIDINGKLFSNVTLSNTKIYEFGNWDNQITSRVFILREDEDVPIGYIDSINGQAYLWELKRKNLVRWR